jgi:adenine/guanine phosphoribosyltransferase-like PRPP-binding protein
VDPRMLPLIEGKRVALVDDVISSGTSIVSGLTLMKSLGIEPVVIGAAMLQSERWNDKLDAFGPQWRERVTGVFRTPMLRKAGEENWIA